MVLSFLLIKKIASMFIMMFLGFLLVKAKILKNSDSTLLSKLILYVVGPCMIIDALQIERTSERLSALALSFLAAFIVHAVFILVGRVLRRPLRLLAVEEASVLYPNAGGLIIPLIAYCLGEEWSYCVSGFIVVQACIMWTYGRARISGNEDIDWKQVLLNVNIIAVFVGIGFFLLRFQLPHILRDAIGDIGDTFGPLSMIILGILLADVQFNQIFRYKRAFLVCGLRLILFPVIIVFLFAKSRLLSLHTYSMNVLMVVLLQSISPTASTITQMAQVFGQDAEYVGVVNVVGVLLCIITMPLIVLLYQLLI